MSSDAKIIIATLILFGVMFTVQQCRDEIPNWEPDGLEDVPYESVR
jgi:hypothetical protein